MITLVISNGLADSYGNYMDPSIDITEIVDYDLEAYRNGRVYHFWSLRDVAKFIDNHPIKFTEKYEEKFTYFSWDELDLNLDIDIHKRNTLIYSMSIHPEWRD